jgi:hypothetical protein
MLLAAVWLSTEFWIQPFQNLIQCRILKSYTDMGCHIYSILIFALKTEEKYGAVSGSNNTPDLYA